MPRRTQLDERRLEAGQAQGKSRREGRRARRDRARMRVDSDEWIRLQVLESRVSEETQGRKVTEVIKKGQEIRGQGRSIERRDVWACRFVTRHRRRPRVCRLERRQAVCPRRGHRSETLGVRRRRGDYWIASHCGGAHRHRRARRPHLLPRVVHRISSIARTMHVVHRDPARFERA